MKSRQALEHLARYYDCVSLEGFVRETKFVATDIRELLTGEARCARAYYTQYAKVIREIAPSLGFKGRRSDSSNNINAADPVNSMLNYGFGVLSGIVRTAVHGAGLDPAIGFIHEPMGQTGTSSPLVYDWEENYRVLVDLTVLDILREGGHRRSDFEWTDQYRSRVGPVIGKRIITVLYDMFRRKVLFHGKSATFSVLVDLDGQRLVRFLQEKQRSLSFEKPLPVDLSLIDAVTRERILTMSVEERKRLGIGKTTYWYQRQKALAGKPTKLYRKVAERLAMGPDLRTGSESPSFPSD